ncbi:hypothetical protein GYH30_044639 [Glycine max]|nr:hypothetical protein GYH30_044639 [Glycine max]
MSVVDVQKSLEARSEVQSVCHAFMMEVEEKEYIVVGNEKRECDDEEHDESGNGIQNNDGCTEERDGSSKLEEDSNLEGDSKCEGLKA